MLETCPLLKINFYTKSTDAHEKLNPRSVITREEGEIGFLIIPLISINSRVD